MRFAEFKLVEAGVPDPDVLRQQQVLKDKGYDLGPYGPKGDGLDGIMGPYTQAAADAMAKGIPPAQATKPSTQSLQQFDKEQDIATGSSSMPVNAPVTQPFGKVSHRGTHPGVDLGAPVGTPIRSPITGSIVAAKMDRSNCGGTISVQAGDEQHLFCHCSQIDVQVGDRVRKGQVVGRTGNTGRSTGPHLHWERRVAGARTDPMDHVG